MEEGIIVELPSNSGWKFMQWTKQDEFEIKGEKIILVEITIDGKYWERNIKKDRYIKNKDCVIKLPQFLLVEARLKELEAKVSKWLKAPIEKLTSKPLKFSKDLCYSQEYISDRQTLVIKFGSFINSVGHFPCTISYKTSCFSGTIQYVVEATCLQVFIDSLRNILGR